MNYGKVLYNDIANGPGVRTSVFVSGCGHRCPGCFNREAWDYEYGEEWTREVRDAVLDSLAPAHVAGLSVLGGEPLDPRNVWAVRDLCREAKTRYPGKTVWVYTGSTFERVLESGYGILGWVDVLVDGPYVEAERDLRLMYRGSRNQRLVDVPRSLGSEDGGVVVWSEGMALSRMG